MTTKVETFETYLKDQQLEQKKLTRNSHKPDLQFPQIIAQMPPTAGIAIGIERLAMVLFNLATIQDLHAIEFELS